MPDVMELLIGVSESDMTTGNDESETRIPLPKKETHFR